jgi:hypothetical protein
VTLFLSRVFGTILHVVEIGFTLLVGFRTSILPPCLGFNGHAKPSFAGHRAPWDDSAAATAAAAATARLPGAIPKAIAKKRAQFEAEQAEKARNAALGVRKLYIP